ncbi:MAG TPA: metalloregulator ArsR/SmtB family transcription factor [Ktedonobacteraceae bacterium]|jgi:ArsR family transcriptional regulator|nr:metalloregulator ArsR/SmtB family transcription factor [Ktedonobacteraceae bacterium]
MSKEQERVIDWRELKAMMKALAGVARLTIVYHLAHRQDQEITVNSLTDVLNISQPLVSWHLNKLKRAGLIETRRVGRQVYCSLNLPRFQQCIRHLEGLIDPAFQVEALPSGPLLIEADAAAER